MRKVEYLRALDDNTWDTVVEDVPSVEEDAKCGVTYDDAGLMRYANNVLLGQAQHRKVVLFAIYNSDVSST